MSELISGKEALKLVADGVVQYIHSSETQEIWTTITDHFWCQYNLGMFLDANTAFKFRLKPRTITINNIEVPAPFEPKDGEIFFYLNSFYEFGYDSRIYHSSNVCGFYHLQAWRTEEEIKQVVAALRQIFK